MKWKDILPPVVARSLSAFANRFLRADDVDDGAGQPVVRLSRPYAQSTWVQAAVNHVAAPISGRPLCFYDGEIELDDRALAAWWERPAVGPRLAGGRRALLTREEVLHDLASWERLCGEFFIVLDDVWLLATASRLGASLPPFFIANPYRMQEVVLGGELQGWRYTDAGGRQMTFLPEQVIHHKGFNPYDDFRGLGRLEAAKLAAEGAYLTAAYVRNLARNNGDQGFNVLARFPMDDTQREQVLAELRAKRRATNRGEVRDMVLGGGDIEVDRPKEQAATPELMASAGMSHQEIFVAFGVPPSLAAVKQAYSVGKESDKYQLITDTCQPVGGKIAGALARIASLQTGRRISAELEWDDHPVMIEVRNSRLEAAARLWDKGMSWKDANDYLSLGMRPFPGWEIPYLPFSVAPVEALPPAVDPAQDPALQEEPTTSDPDVQRIRLLMLGRMKCARSAKAAPSAAEGWLAAFACGCGCATGTIEQKARDPKEVAQWRDLMSKRRTTVASFKGAFGRVVMAARAEVLRNLAATGKTLPAIGKASVQDLLFDLAKFSEAFLKAMAAQQRLALEISGRQLFAEIGKDDPFKYPGAEVLNFLAARENKLVDTPRAIHEEIKATLEEGILAGETTDQLSARVRSTFNGVSDRRAQTIAMTETAAAYGAGRDEAMRQASVRYKRWLTSGGDNVRSAHAAANGQTVRIDEAYEVGGEMLQFPGDDAGSAENVINCHCVSIAVAAEDAT